MKHLYVLILFILPYLAHGQLVYNVNFQTVKFGGPGVTITNKVGNGTTAGSVVLYQNVVTIGGQSIDAIIRTTSLSAGATMVFDEPGTGTGYTNNSPTWFSPQFNFPTGGGSALFNFEFILGGSYNNTTNTGTPVTLQKVMINSYDIDGNGNTNSKQYSEFGGFFTSEMATTNLLNTTYNATTNLTKFISTTDANIVDASDPRTRVRVTYQDLSNFQIAVGTPGHGTAYFFIDFDAGPPFNVPTTTLTSPTPDLNTTTPGNNNSAITCSSSAAFTTGTTNIPSYSSTPSGGTTLERLKLSYTTSSILNGAAEKLLIAGATSGASIDLNFTDGAAIPNITLSGTIYSVTASVISGKSSLIFMKNGSTTMTIAQGETLLDAFYYNNTSSSIIPGDRVFDINIKDGAYESQAYSFTVSAGFTPTISQQAQNATTTENSTTSFNIISTATSYQWQVDPGTGAYSTINNGGVYSGATTNTLTLTNVPFSMNNYHFRCITSGGSCITNSSSGSLIINAALAVRWSNFSATKSNNIVELSWGTNAEINTKTFVVQSSTDGINFIDIGSVNARGNSTVISKYGFTDLHPVNGNNFYRIQEIDADNRYVYSKVITIQFGDAGSLVIFSNPVTNGQINFRISKQSPLLLFNSVGNLVYKEQLSAGSHSINVSAYPKGIYTIIAGTETKKILIH